MLYFIKLYSVMIPLHFKSCGFLYGIHGCIHVYTCSCGVLPATPGGLGGDVLRKELRSREVGVSRTPFTLRHIAPGLCNELGVTDNKYVCVQRCVTGRVRKLEKKKKINFHVHWYIHLVLHLHI